MIMRRLNAVVNDQQFIPAQSRERFRVAMTDHGSTILLPKLIERLRKNAPDSELVLSAVGTHLTRSLQVGSISTFAQTRFRLRWKVRSFSDSISFVSWTRANDQEPPTYVETIFTIAARDDPDR